MERQQVCRPGSVSMLRAWKGTFGDIGYGAV
jgi:hypothetical protein